MLNPNDHVLDYVDAYVHDALPRDEDEAVALHCRHCPICQVALEQARKRFAALRSLPAPPVSEKMLKDLEKRIARQRRRRFSPPQMALAGVAAAALLIGCCQVYFNSLEPSPYDLRVLGQSELLAGSDASLRVLLLNHTNARPVVGIPVSVELRSPDGRQAVTLCKAVTDRAGTIAPRIALARLERRRL